MNKDTEEWLLGKDKLSNLSGLSDLTTCLINSLNNEMIPQNIISVNDSNPLIKKITGNAIIRLSDINLQDIYKNVIYFI